MVFFIALGAAAAVLYAIGHVIGLTHGIEVERKRWKLRQAEEKKFEETPADCVVGAVWRN
jgi:hypothetical protein